MAINKEKNINLQLTISKELLSDLEQIQSAINTKLSANFSKSQIIAFMIKSNLKKPFNILGFLSDEESHETQEQKATPKPTEQTEIKAPLSANDEGKKEPSMIQENLIKLKAKLNYSWPRLSQYLGIPTSTLKKYANGNQQPQAENNKILLKAFISNGIK